jgi:hypothetical protein
MSRKPIKPATNGDEAPKFKKGNITFAGINFNDDWARKLKAGKYAPDGKDSAELSPKELFIKEHFSQPNLAEMSEAEKTELLGKAYDACMAAV